MLTDRAPCRVGERKAIHSSTEVPFWWCDAYPSREGGLTPNWRIRFIRVRTIGGMCVVVLWLTISANPRSVCHCLCHGDRGCCTCTQDIGIQALELGQRIQGRDLG